jgi:hypothetical protein
VWGAAGEGGVGRQEAVEMGNMGAAHHRTDEHGGSGLSWSWTPSKLARQQGFWEGRERGERKSKEINTTE